MDYAVIENGTVVNVIFLLQKNAGEFPKAVPMDGIPAAIGDGYAEGIFYRAGEQIKGLAEMVLENVDYKALYETVLADMSGLVSPLSGLTSFLPDTVKSILQKYKEKMT